jgi:hypothetical protein
MTNPLGKTILDRICSKMRGIYEFHAGDVKAETDLLNPTEKEALFRHCNFEWSSNLSQSDKLRREILRIILDAEWSQR